MSKKDLEMLQLYERAIDLANEQLEIVKKLMQLKELKKEIKKEIKGNA